MKAQNCKKEDLNEIQTLYQHARNTQTEKGMVVWPSFSNEFLLNEIGEDRQWKITEGETIACNWAITYNDKEIWGEKDNSDSIFIHRLCINTAFRGRRYIDDVVTWAKVFAVQNQKQFIRLDTLGNNKGLIKHYTSAGFTFLGIFHLADVSNLPLHYHLEPDCCLFEIGL